MKTLGLTEGDVRNRYNRLTKEINAAKKEDKNFGSICQEIEEHSFKTEPQRWKTYCQKLMAVDSTDSHSHNIGATEELEPPILQQEVEKAVQRLSGQKAAGNDGIVTEMLKAT
ncbi:hypothetical protein HHI36_003991 [Cryptolaemus montrouzieri]|uniref:Uncharacterized protein n=1 Tax=Cryptolaemus montrouzieri TaxID=559131 RepID=A0ABD2NPW6_9CUCU